MNVTKIKKKIKYVFILNVLILLLQSETKVWAVGFGFVEKGHFHKNGSGEFSFTVDLTKTENIILLLRFFNKDYRKTTTIIGYNSFLVTEKYLKNIKGISNITIYCDDKMLKFTLSFNFQNIQTLNKALQIIYKNMDSPTVAYFILSDQVFVRDDVNSIAKKLIQYQEYDSSLVKSFDLDFFFRNITYTTYYSFERKIKQCTNPLSVISKDRKTIYIKHYVLNKNEISYSIRERIHFED